LAQFDRRRMTEALGLDDHLRGSIVSCKVMVRIDSKGIGSSRVPNCIRNDCVTRSTLVFDRSRYDELRPRCFRVPASSQSGFDCPLDVMRRD
jgi:hypothetical protein